MKRLIAQLFGLVQGVGFRYFTKMKAEELGLSGWVKNEPDGSVTIVAEGEEEKLKELIKEIEKGPSFAQVKEIKIKWEKPKGEKGFEVRF